MARTTFDETLLRLSSPLISAGHTRNRVFSHNGSRGDAHSVGNHSHHSDDSSVNRNINVWDDESNVSMNGDSSQSFSCWRRFLYFGLSSPTYFDVELLDRIRSFGKLKTAIVLFIICLVLMTCGIGWKMNDTEETFSINSCKFPFSWLSIHTLIQDFVTSATQEGITLNETQEMLSKVDMKILIQEVLEEEIIPQFLSQRKSQRAKDTISINDIKKELSAFNKKMSSLSETLSAMQARSAQESKWSSTLHEKNLQQEKQFQEITDEIRKLQEHIVVLDGMITTTKSCCRNDTEIERQAAAVLLSVMSPNPKSPTAKLFRDWLSTQHVSTEHFRDQVKKIRADAADQTEHLKSKLASQVKESIDSVRQEFNKKATVKNLNGLSHDEVEKIIKDAIDLYDADKTGKTDYALENGGGSVVNTRCSKSYDEGRPTYSIIGLSWTPSSNPRSAIQPNMYPGSCWAFHGSNGYLVVQLSTRIRPTSFVIQHIPKSISPTQNIDTAPKDFKVWGLDSEKDEIGALLGEYTYDKHGEPLQFFPVQYSDERSFSYIELQVQSNHGEPRYTCLYRFRVHGKPV